LGQRRGSGCLRYVDGDATQLAGEGRKFLLHVVNNRGTWGEGFELALSARWPEPEETYRMHLKHTAKEALLGQISYCFVGAKTYVVNMVAQDGTRSKTNPKPSIRLDALRTCLEEVAGLALAGRNPATVHAPKFGEGLAGGDWEAEIEPLVRECLVDKGIDCVVSTLREES
jgi:hypothetical protein